jgi:putative spermidine/putrescine transport system permease protein/spermidine/putrescine transport system permease protein
MSAIIARAADVEAPRVGLRALRRIAAFLGIFAIALNYVPMLWLALMSFSADPMSGVPGPWTTEWYRALIDNQSWVGPLVASIVTGLGIGLACTAAGLLVARVAPALSAGSRGRLIGTLLFPLLVPGVLLGAGLFIYLRVLLQMKLGWWSIFIAHFVWSYPFALLALLITSSRYDHRLTEAATDLGASPWEAFRDVELPFLLPGLVSAGLFGFLFSFSELSRSIFLRGGRTTLPIFEWIEASAHQSSIPLIFALSTLELTVSGLLVVGAFWLLFARRR